MTVANAWVIALPDALHARPANLLVRLAASFDAKVTVTARSGEANAASILEVLALGAAKGDSITLTAEGNDAERALAEIYKLVDRNFDGDLVPERGEGGASGVAIGRAFILESEHSGGDATTTSEGSASEELGKLAGAAVRVEADLILLLAELPPSEAQLFAPAVPMLADLARLARDAIQEGLGADAAVRRHTENAAMDLVLDVRARLLDALAGGDAFARVFGDVRGEEHILVTGNLVPSLVALAPRSIAGIVASRPAEQTGRAAQSTSHASILARGRGLPLAIVPEHVVESIVDDEWVVVDANETEARVWIAPSEAFLAEARGKRNAQIAEAKEIGLASLDKLDHLGVAVRVNIGALSEGIPQGADGVGLVRTELLFAGRRHPPDEADLVHAFASIAKAAAPAPTVIRLYDAGGDKPLDWLPAPADDPGARGIALLLRHPEMLKAQLRAAGLLEREHDIRVLIPLTRGAEDVHAVRDLAPPHLRNKVGAMIETLDAVDQSDAIARASDFVCIGTNDLSSFLGAGEPLVGSRVLTLVSRVLCAAKAHSRAVTVCGEMAGDSLGARVLVGVGVDALSVSPSKVPSVKATLRRATRESCREDAERLLGRTIS